MKIKRIDRLCASNDPVIRSMLSIDGAESLFARQRLKVISRHWLLQMNPEETDLLQTRLREGHEAVKEPPRSKAKTIFRSRELLL